MSNEIKLPNGNTVVPGSWVNLEGEKRWLIEVDTEGRAWLTALRERREQFTPVWTYLESITGPWIEPPKPNPLPKLLDGAMPPRGWWLYWYDGRTYASKARPQAACRSVDGFVVHGESYAFLFVDWTGIPPEQRCAETDRFHDEKPATRYDWSKAPEWAEWAATDEDGEAYWYKDRPKLINSGNMWGGKILMYSHTRRVHDWRESLERRPGK